MKRAFAGLLAAMIAAAQPAEGASLILGGGTNLPWIDASYTANATASVPSALAATVLRAGFHITNVGSTNTACFNYTSAAVTSGSGCAPGSTPIYPGGGYTEDWPANVSPEAISIVCAGSSCPLTIKVR